MILLTTLITKNMNTIKYAENWFRLQNISTIIQENKMYISNGHFEFELSVEEIKYRAECYLDSEKQKVINN